MDSQQCFSISRPRFVGSGIPDRTAQPALPTVMCLLRYVLPVPATVPDGTGDERARAGQSEHLSIGELQRNRQLQATCLPGGHHIHTFCMAAGEDYSTSAFLPGVFPMYSAKILPKALQSASLTDLISQVLPEMQQSGRILR